MNRSLQKQASNGILQSPKRYGNDQWGGIKENKNSPNFRTRESQEVDLSKYQRIAHMDNTAAFGFGGSDDRLGKLAEINKMQVQCAIRGMNNFVQTGTNFMIKNPSSNRNKSVIINDIKAADN